VKNMPATTDEAAGGTDAHASPTRAPEGVTSSGIAALDERLGGGLRKGGVYVAAGPPGQEKRVAALHFLHEGVSRGERGLLLSGAPPHDILAGAAAWGIDLRDAIENGALEVLGFREDFERRAMRSAEPEDVLHELASLVGPDIARIVVDPGCPLIKGGARMTLGRAFLEWARNHPATILTTLSIDGPELPASAEWLLQAATAVFLFEQGEDGLCSVDLRHLFAAPGLLRRITLQLSAGRGLGTPEGSPSRRRSDRPVGHPDRLLFLSLCEELAHDLEGWARGVFTTDVVHEPIEAVSSLQSGPGFGCILIYASRARVPDAVRTCRALRPLTRASILVASDDAIRASDRVDLLEAGADDCLSGGVDVRELGARIHQAVEAGGKSSPKEVWKKRERLVGGLVDGRVFASEIHARIVDPWKSVLTVMRVSHGVERSERLQGFLAEEIRVEQGDMLVAVDRAFLVLLQGARRDAAGVFLDRVRRRAAAENGAAPVRSEVFSNPGERQDILGLLGLLHGGEAPMREVDPEEAHAREG
jgi:RecA/RadA recombinase